MAAGQIQQYILFSRIHHVSRLIDYSLQYVASLTLIDVCLNAQLLTAFLTASSCSDHGQIDNATWCLIAHCDLAGLGMVVRL